MTIRIGSGGRFYWDYVEKLEDKVSKSCKALGSGRLSTRCRNSPKTSSFCIRVPMEKQNNVRLLRVKSYLWLVGNEGMGYNHNYYYYHSSIPY